MQSFSFSAATRLPETLTAALQTLLAGGRMGIAYSGGLDSRFLAHAALLVARRQALPPPVLAHVQGPHIPRAESVWARDWATRAGLALYEVAVYPLTLPEVAANGKERCYHCKRALFTALRARLAAEFPALTLCDGSNASDHEGYRPGLRALRELLVRSPLDEAGLTKAEIRALAAQTGLERPDQAARPCLLTRFPYGFRPTADGLRRIEALEARVERVLEDMAGAGGNVPDFRIRVGEGGLLTLQLGTDAAPEAEALLGQTLDAPGLRIVRTDSPSGYFDRAATAESPL